MAYILSRISIQFLTVVKGLLSQGYAPVRMFLKLNEVGTQSPTQPWVTDFAKYATK